jgi:hypothetical protein
MLLALCGCSSSQQPKLSEAEAIRIAESEVARSFSRDPSYASEHQRTGSWYLSEDHTWVVVYEHKVYHSRFTVQVDDRTREATIWMP